MGIRTVPPPTQTDFDIFDKPPPNIRLTIPAAPALAEPLPLVEPLALTPHCPYLADAHAYARIVRLANANKIPYIGRVIMTGDALGSVTEDLNVAVRGAKNILRYDTPEKMKLAALCCLKQLTEAFENWEQEQKRAKVTPLHHRREYRDNTL